MKHPPWDAETAAAIGIDWLLSRSAPAGEFGWRRRARQRVFAPGDEPEAQARIAQVVRVAETLEAERLEALRAALAGIPDPGPALVRASAGEVLGDVDFFELNRFFAALDEIRTLASHRAFTGSELPSGGDALRDALAPGRTPQRGFYLDDEFASGLAAARARANERQTAYDLARGALLARAAAALGLDHLRDGEFTLLRDVTPGPLPPEVRVLREAPAYFACELALDAPALAALAARDAAAAAVAEAEEEVRARLSRLAGAAAADLQRACEVLGELDVLTGCARFAQRYACVAPHVVEWGAPFAFEDARYLPLAEALAESGRSYAPISLELDGVAVVTGPNMGGKTAALRTSGFVAACVALGLPVPARAAGVPLFDEVAWIGIVRGEESNDGERRLLSSFGSEVRALRDLFERDARRALVLIDEFARTTTPREGRALLVALLQRLAERDARALAATHLHGVAREAGAAHYAIAGLRALPPRSRPPLALGAALHLIAEAMDYRLRRGGEEDAAQADALALADALGLDEELVARARRELTRRS